MRAVKRCCLVIPLLAFCQPAEAHGGAGYEPAEAATVFSLLVIAVLYAFGAARLWRRAGVRGISAAQAAMFAVGWAALALLLLPGVRELSAGMFTAHMVEHEWAILIAAPLLVLSRPFAAFAWAAPRLTQSLGKPRKWLHRAWRMATQPLFATIQHAFAVWIWHASSLYDLALRNATAHFVQHACLLASALIFWRAMLLSPQKGLALFCLFFTVAQSGFLGVLLTVSESLWTERQSASASAWGLTAIEDQQLAGLIMWVPAGLLYTAAALWIASGWIKHAQHPSLRAN
jgi:putative membrane protein